MTLMDPCISCPHNPNADIPNLCINHELSKEKFSEEELKTKVIELFSKLSYKSKNSLSRAFVLELEKAEQFGIIKMLLT